MITLKKSFELANYYEELVKKAYIYLDPRYVVKTVEKHFKSKSYSAAEDEVIEVPREVNLDERITNNVLIDFCGYMLGEICRLNDAVEKAKNAAEESFDTLVANNAVKHRLIERLRTLAEIKSSEIKKDGIAYKFNETGDQVRYSYPMEIVKTIDFDRNAVKKQLNKLRAETEEISEKIELMKLNIQVDYDGIFTRGDSFEDAVLTYLENR